jgi:Na+/melibiose symporter-like transporter
MVMVLCGLQTFFSCSNDVISRTITPDIWDYQQWKTGERLEASNGLLSTYIFGPIGIAMGIIMPFILKIIGFTSDWNIFYDADIRNRYITVNIIIGALSNLLPAIPYMFYDLNKDKMLKINADLLERAAAKDAENEAFAAVPAEGGAAE